MTQNQKKIPTMLQHLFMALGMSSMLLEKASHGQPLRVLTTPSLWLSGVVRATNDITLYGH